MKQLHFVTRISCSHMLQYVASEPSNGVNLVFMLKGMNNLVNHPAGTEMVLICSFRVGHNVTAI